MGSTGTGVVPNTCAACWEFLIEQAGIDLDYYDAALVEELCSHFAVKTPPQSLGVVLDDHGVSVEGLIGAFLKAAEPYACMMSDLCCFFYGHGVKRTNEAMRVLFDFGAGPEDLGFDLRHFREWLWTWRRLTERVAVYWWTSEALWKLTQALRRATARGNVPGNEIQEWLERYQNRARILPLPSAPEVAGPRANAIIASAWRVWETVVLACVRYGDTWDRFRFKAEEAAVKCRKESREAQEVAAPRPEHLELPSFGDWDPRTLYVLDSDRWQGETALALGLWSTPLIGAPAEECDRLARPVAESVERILASLRRTEDSREVLERSLVEFLSLPVWKHRHNLYQTWVLSQIMAALGEYPLEVHHIDGSLLLRFSGTHVATAASLGGNVHVWSELRSAFPKPRGKRRKRHIQSDYSLVLPPVTEPSATRVVVECKQYRAPDARVFTDAVADYAKGRPAAAVILVNYGPLRDDLRARVEEEVRDRVWFFGLFRPGNDTALSDFRKAVRAMLPPPGARPAGVSAGFSTIAVDVSGSMEDVLESPAVRRLIELAAASSPGAELLAVDTDVRFRGHASAEDVQRLLARPRSGGTSLPSALVGTDVSAALVVTDADGWSQLAEAGMHPRLAVVTDRDETAVRV